MAAAQTKPAGQTKPKPNSTSSTPASLHTAAAASEPAPGELPKRPAPAPPLLCVPATVGEYDKVQALLRKGADVNSSDTLSRTPLMLALARPDTTSGGNAPLPAPKAGDSSEKQHQRKLKIAKLLLQRGADVRKRSEIGMTALHYAAIWQGEEAAALEIARALVAKGADVDARMAAGMTPLRMAVDRHRVQLVRFLVEAGADPEVADDDEQTPLRRAKQLRSSELMEALKPPQAPAANPQAPAASPQAPAANPQAPAASPQAPAVK